MKGVGRYWGYLGLLALVVTWSAPVGAAVTLALSGLLTVYFLFQVPVWCGALRRDGKLCRNNSNGLLMGCYLRQHKWQKLQMLVLPSAWRQLVRELWINTRTRVMTASAVVSLISGVASLIALAAGG